MACNGLAQALHAQRGGVAGVAGVNGRLERLHHAGCGGEVGFADAQVDDGSAGTFQIAGTLDQLHHAKGFDAGGTLRQAQRQFGGGGGHAPIVAAPRCRPGFCHRAGCSAIPGLKMRV
jgi:hypothetical protein